MNFPKETLHRYRLCERPDHACEIMVSRLLHRPRRWELTAEINSLARHGGFWVIRLVARDLNAIPVDSPSHRLLSKLVQILSLALLVFAEPEPCLCPAPREAPESFRDALCNALAYQSAEAGQALECWRERG